MAKPNWYNENSNRAFPFQARTVGLPVISGVTLQNLPDNAIVDCGFVMGLQSGFIAGRHSVQLDSVQRSGSSLIFTFVCDAPALNGKTLQFTRAVTDTGYITEYVESSESPAASFTSESVSIYEPVSESLGDCNAAVLWSGYLVTGNLSTLTQSPFLSGNGTLYNGPGAATVEDGLIQNTSGSFISSITLLNRDRTRVSPPDSCSDSAIVDTWEFPTGNDIYYLAAKCMTGDIRFSGGYNASVLQNTQNNSLTFAASPGDGAGQVCSQTAPLFPGESVSNAAAAAGLSLLEGGPHCNQVVRTINGIGGPFYFLTAGTGVQITPEPEAHAIIIDINMRGLAFCSSASMFFVSESLSH